MSHTDELRKYINLLEELNNVNLSEIHMEIKRRTSGHGDTEQYIEFTWDRPWIIDDVVNAMNNAVQNAEGPSGEFLNQSYGTTFSINRRTVGHGDTEPTIDVQSAAMGDWGSNINQVLHALQDIFNSSSF